MIRVKLIPSNETKDFPTVKEMVMALSSGRGKECTPVRISVSPEIAVEILEYQILHGRKTNFINRGVSSSHVTKYVKEVMKGEWVYNPLSPIGFDDKGNFIQGQHRLNAIIRSGKTCDFFAIFNSPSKAFVYLDNGKFRGLNDILVTKGFPKKQASVLAGTLKLVSKFRKGTIDKFDHSKTPNHFCLQLLENEPLIAESVRSWYHNKDLRMFLGSNTTCFIHYIFSQISLEKANEFLSKLASGSNLNEKSPILLLRKDLIRTYQKRSPSGGRFRAEVKIAWVIIAWNAWMQNKNLKTIKYDPDADKFPEIYGCIEGIVEEETNEQEVVSTH